MASFRWLRKWIQAGSKRPLAPGRDRLLYNKFARFIFGIQLRDIDCDFRLIRRSLLEDCHSSAPVEPCAWNWSRSWSCARTS